MHSETPLDRRRNIWVVDDSPTDSERVRRLFASQHTVEVLHDGATALERLASGDRPDLILLDWVMPGMSGIEVCKYLRSSASELSSIPIILLTARYGPEEIVEAFSCGASDYVSKPFIENELKARVESLLHSKRLLQRAEQAEGDVRSLLSTAPDPIFAVNAQGNIKFVNDEGIRVLQKSKEEILGTPFHSLVADFSFSNLKISGGADLLPIPDVKIADKVFSPSIRVLPSDSAATTTVVLRDVTARRQADSRRLDFYSVIAHDLRTPITSILLRLEMAFRGKHGVLPAAHIGDLRKTETSLRSLVGMINDFLELARLEGVGYKIDRQPIDLNDLVSSTMDDFRPLLEKNDLDWSHVSDSTKTVVLGDRQRLTQVLANLFGNAIKFTPAPGQIKTAIAVTEEHVEVSITDTGRGIAKEEIPGLFDRYTRSADVGRDTPGTGLGLMIVREIVEAHGGIIGAESEVGKGSTFWFRLPRSKA